MAENVISPTFGRQLCAFCHRRPATKLCDAPTGRFRWMGHPPGRFFYEIEGKPLEWTMICNRPICDECATELGGEIDFCPRCMERIKAMKGGT